MRLDEILTRLIEARGPSNREVARQVSRRLNAATGREGVSATTVGTWLTPEGDPRLSELRALADYFEMSVAELIGEAPAERTLSHDDREDLAICRKLRAAIGGAEALRDVLLDLLTGAGPPPGGSVAPAPEDAQVRRPGPQRKQRG